VTWAIEEKDYSQRRACLLVGMAPKTYRYVSRRPDDGEVRVRLRALANERRRFGYRRLHILLAREGHRLNHKKLFRLYRAERLGVRRRGVRKRALGTRAPMALPQGKNQRWSLDFVSDALACGRRFRVLAVVDDFTRECLALVADTSLSGLRVGRELDRIVALRGRPAMIVSDNGTELTSHAMLRWQQERGVGWHYIAPGKPQQNGFVESFNVSLRRGPPTAVGLNLSCDPTGVLWSAVKDRGGWRDGNHHWGRAAASLAAGGETADTCRVGRAWDEVRRRGAPARGEPRSAVAMA
jgi:putative transposase